MCSKPSEWPLSWPSCTLKLATNPPTYSNASALIHQPRQRNAILGQPTLPPLPSTQEGCSPSPRQLSTSSLSLWPSRESSHSLLRSLKGEPLFMGVPVQHMPNKIIIKCPISEKAEALSGTHPHQGVPDPSFRTRSPTVNKHLAMFKEEISHHH